MIFAGKAANRKGIPVVLDPVGAGATRFRSDTVKRIMNEVAISVLRGNASEIFSLSAADVKTRGVDSSLGLSPEMAASIKTLAQNLNCIIAVSGAEDIITDGRDMFTTANGQPLMTRVTGIGCGLSAVVGAFCAAGDTDLLPATAAAFAVYGLCGDLAVKISPKPGGFFPAFVDALYGIRDEDIQAGLRVTSLVEG
jgi:hydroxyethylthiazole kinase